MHINNNSYNIASQAINRGLYTINQTAYSIAQNGTTDDAKKDTDLISDLVELKQTSQHIKANMQVIKTIQETEEYLIDIMA